MSRSSVLALVTALPILVTACGGGEDTEFALASAEVAALVPADAVAFAQVRSLDALEADVRGIAGSFDSAAAADVDVDELLAQLGPAAGDVTLIDRARPLGVAVVLPAGGMPGLLVIVPAKDPAAYRDSLSAVPQVGGPPLVDGRYVVVSVGGGYAKPESAPAFATAMPAGLLTARVNVHQLVTAFRPMIDAALLQAEQAMSPEVIGEMPGLDFVQLGQLMKLYLDGARAVLDSAETVELSASLAGGELVTDARLTALAGSALDGWSSPAEVDLGELLAFLDPDAPIAFVSAADFAELWRRTKPFYERLTAAYAEPLRGMMTAWADVYADMYGAMGSAMAVSVRLGGEGGFRMAMHVRPDDGDAFLAGYARIMESPLVEDLGIVFEEPAVTAVDGIQVRGYPVRFDGAKFSEWMGRIFSAMGEEAPADEREAAGQAMRSVFGDGPFAVRLASRGGKAAVVVNGDDAYLKRAIAGPAAGGGPPPAALQAAVERLAGTNPCFVYHLDLAGILALAGSFGPPGAWPPIEVPPGASAPMTLYGGVRGTEWRAGMRWDLGGFAELVKPRARPK